MTNNSKAIVTFCSYLCAADDVRPLSPTEWDNVAKTLTQIKKIPSDLFTFAYSDFRNSLSMSDELATRMCRLVDRSVSLAFEVSDWESRGVYIATRADKDIYPSIIRQKLKNLCPPLFYYIGNPEIFKKKSVGFVGSRNTEYADARFTTDTVAKVIKNEYAIVSGGAKGVDTFAFESAYSNGGFVIDFLGDSIINKLKDIKTLELVQNGQMILASSIVPNAGFKAGNLMARNKYIYCQSEATVVVRSDKKGGTWTGANEALQHGWCDVLCWNKDYDGNRELIKMGAKPINEDWNGAPFDKKSETKIETFSIEDEVTEKEIQMSLFD